MAKYQKYAEYKESGVDWLGEIPSHWDFSCLKYALNKVIAGGTPESTNDAYWAESGFGIPWVSIADITKSFEIIKTKRDVTEVGLAVKNLQILPKGTILYSIFASLGKVSIARVPLVTNQAILGLIPEESKLDSKYLVHWLQAIEGNLGFFSTSNTQDNLNAEKVGNLPLFNPPLNEQCQIANFLDYETAKIDTLLAKQEKLIELLKEKRQAVISHAVTKGLNPNVPMKDSGVEWLGEVPEHWDICKTQYYAKIESGHTPSKTNERYWENCTIPWVSLNDSKQLRVVDYISDTKYKISELGLANSSARILPKDTVVFTRDASIGLSAITTKEIAVSQHLIAWLPKKERLSPEFLLLIFYAMEKEFNRYTFGSTIKTIGMDDVSSLMAAFPSLVEQIDIVERCFSQFLLIDKSIGKSLALLDVLKEKRTALISAAVTGKIDVRNWQHPNQKNNNNTELSA